VRNPVADEREDDDDESASTITRSCRKPVRRTQPWGLGWRAQPSRHRRKAGANLLGRHVYGHTGATGTTVWIDSAHRRLLHPADISGPRGKAPWATCAPGERRGSRVLCDRRVHFFKYLSNQARSHSIFALRFESFVKPCGSPGYTTNCVGTSTYSFSARVEHAAMTRRAALVARRRTWINVGVLHIAQLIRRRRPSCKSPASPTAAPS